MPLSLSTLAIHGDDEHNNIPDQIAYGIQDVAPALHVSTTFRYSNNPDHLVEARYYDPDTEQGHVYSRESAPNTTRLESILSRLVKGQAVVYGTGLSALFAIYAHLKPRRVSVGEGYHGSHDVLDMHTRLTGLQLLPLDCPAEDLGVGDVIHLETPLNPTGEAFEIEHYARKAHSRGAFLLVDSTFAPPGLQDPFELGADVVMHSGTKYFGGHSDLLCGVLAVKDEERCKDLVHDRGVLGSVMGNMEAWLTIRSLRTLEVRVAKQSRTAEDLVDWLDGLLSGTTTDDRAALVKNTVAAIHHASLQARDPKNAWLSKQMPNGYGPVFAIIMRSPDQARRLPSFLRLFHHATSLGGVESLIEWRAMSDKKVDRGLLRLSIGLEDLQDLKDDLLQALAKL